MSDVRTIGVFSDTRGKATCRGCGAAIEWAEIAKSGKKMCFTGEILALRTAREEATGRLIEFVEFDTNHWATCPAASQFKGGRK